MREPIFKPDPEPIINPDKFWTVIAWVVFWFMMMGAHLVVKWFIVDILGWFPR